MKKGKNKRSVGAFGMKVMDPASLPLKKIKERESQESVSRFSEKSLHSYYKIREESARTIFLRVPFATLLGFILGITGVIMFEICRSKANKVMLNALNYYFDTKKLSLHTYYVYFIALEVVFIVVSVLVVIMGSLTTGDTKYRIYAAWKARIGGRSFCVFLMLLSLALLVLWMLNFWYWTLIYSINYILKYQCLIKFSCLVLFDYTVLMENPAELGLLGFCRTDDRTRYCDEVPPKVMPYLVLILIACALVILALIIFLICLAVNYTLIHTQAKIQELEEMRSLEFDISSSKDRF